ncbi:MAG: ATP--guanido phosphotransferase [Clostridia bacterium]|nr:ATP--guanido phosphotransferase [Clostridia bacterium]
MSIQQKYESVAVSSRIRLARNFADYPFPARLLRDAHAEEQAQEIIQLVSAKLSRLDAFVLYEMKNLSDERAAFLVERNLVSRELISNRRISAALILRDESMSVMINEEDHIRAQYFIRGFDLGKAFERISGIDDAISESIPFAYDDMFGYLTACPTNLGTGLRASVMCFLPAVSRRGLMRRISPELTRLGLTVRGAFGEGSGAEGDLFQISNEVTLGQSEGDILSVVERAVSTVVEFELRERDRMKAEEGLALKDKIMRSYGVLTNACKMDLREFSARISDVKLGVALGYFKDEEDDDRMRELDDLFVEMRPANINRLNGAPLCKEEQDEYRAEYACIKIRKMQLKA